MRVQKIIADAGYCSRRKAETLILQNKVKVNRRVVRLGDNADPEKDEITVFGKPLNKQKKLYLALNKPVGFVTTCFDPKMKNTIFTLPAVRRIKERLYPVGRLDLDTSGLIILTNDGDFANIVMHPRYEIEKTYLVALQRPITKNNLNKIRLGVHVDGRLTWPAKVQRLGPNIVRVTIHEGRNRIIRKMFKAIGFHVIALERIAISSVTIGELRYGHVRELTREEKESLAPRKHTNNHKIHNGDKHHYAPPAGPFARLSSEPPPINYKAKRNNLSYKRNYSKKK